MYLEELKKGKCYKIINSQNIIYIIYDRNLIWREKYINIYYSNAITCEIICDRGTWDWNDKGFTSVKINNENIINNIFPITKKDFYKKFRLFSIKYGWWYRISFKNT